MLRTKPEQIRPPKCIYCPIRKLALFQPLTKTEVGSAQKYKSGDRILPAGTVSYQQESPCMDVYTLFHGWGFLYKDLDNGKRQILSFVLPGDFLGFQGDLEKGIYQHSARTLTSVSLCVFPYSNLMKLFRKHPKLGVRLTWMTAYDNALAYEHLTSLGRRSAHDRIAHLLLELFHRVRLRQKTPSSDNSIDFPLTQEMIGNTVGLTAIHVNRTLMELRREGWIEIKSKRLTIPDPEALSELIGFKINTFDRRQMI